MRILIATLLLVSLEASANTIVISDIDDTIRHSNVRNLQQLTVLKQAEFSGLSKLYRQLEKTIRRFEYVSGVPQQVRAVSEFFIYWNLFPQGRLFARDTQFDTITHKLKAIDQVVRENVPTKMLLFGDNGEHDTEIYEKVDAKYPNKAVIFMHQLYNEEIPANQISWLTSIDLALHLHSQGYVTTEAVEEVLGYAGKKLTGKKKDREEFFPSWGECRTFFKNYSRPQVQLARSQEEIVVLYENFLAERCL